MPVRISDLQGYILNQDPQMFKRFSFCSSVQLLCNRCCYTQIPQKPPRREVDITPRKLSLSRCQLTYHHTGELDTSRKGDTSTIQFTVTVVTGPKGFRHVWPRYPGQFTKPPFTEQNQFINPEHSTLSPQQVTSGVSYLCCC